MIEYLTMEDNAETVLQKLVNPLNDEHWKIIDTYPLPFFRIEIHDRDPKRGEQIKTLIIKMIVEYQNQESEIQELTANNKILGESINEKVTQIEGLNLDLLSTEEKVRQLQQVEIVQKGIIDNLQQFKDAFDKIDIEKLLEFLQDGIDKEDEFITKLKFVQTFLRTQ